MSLYFSTAMKEVTNAVTGAGIKAEGTWRDYTSTDNQEGWIGKSLVLAPGQTKEIDVEIVGAWDDFSGATGTYDFWALPLVSWFYGNSMSNAQATTENYWSNWLASGVTANLPGAQYNNLFTRSLLVAALSIDGADGGIVAGMHNGLYPFVWPRDGIYAAVTLDRTGHTQEAAGMYRFLRDVAFRYTNDCTATGYSFFLGKYSQDGYYIWSAPELDESASVPWGLYYHYLVTGDASFLTAYANMSDQSAHAASETSCINGLAYYDTTYHLMNCDSLWENLFGEFIYSNGSVVRGLNDAANIIDVVGGYGSDAATFRSRASDILTNGIIPRMNARVEPSDISHLGLSIPWEVISPADPVMTNVVQWINGKQSAGTCGTCSGGPYTDDLVENDTNYPDIIGLVDRYIHNLNGNLDTYWGNEEPGHNPWFAATSWYGEYFARWQDYVGGTALVDTNLYTLNLVINKLGPRGLGAEEIAPNTALQKYPGFWLQTAWPNVWESHTSFIDQMMMFLDYKPEGTNNNTCYFAPKLPDGWNSFGFNNMYSQGQRFNINISQANSSAASNQYTRADIYKTTSGSLNADIWLRIPTNTVPVMIVVNNTYTNASPSQYDTTTGRVHIQAALSSGVGSNVLAVTFGNDDFDHDGLTDSNEMYVTHTNPLEYSTAGDGQGDGCKIANGCNPFVYDPCGCTACQ
jgi:hypothetical protein